MENQESTEYKQLLCAQCQTVKDLNEENFTRINENQFQAFCKPCMEEIKDKVKEIEDFNKNNSPLFKE
jgi:hypothetical protein